MSMTVFESKKEIHKFVGQQELHIYRMVPETLRNREQYEGTIQKRQLSGKCETLLWDKG